MTAVLMWRGTGCQLIADATIVLARARACGAAPLGMVAIARFFSVWLAMMLLFCSAQKTVMGRY